MQWFYRSVILQHTILEHNGGHGLLAARLAVLDAEVKATRDAYVTNDNPAKDSKLKKIWKASVADRAALTQIYL